MKKMNKKGFTLIEMLVVIAIIAVLVSIIIPTVMSSTDKAAAATNAANLRSIVAEVTTAHLSGDNSRYVITYDANGNPVSAAPAHGVTAPAAKKVTGLCDANAALTITYENGLWVAKYNGKDVDDFAGKAGNS